MQLAMTDKAIIFNSARAGDQINFILPNWTLNRLTWIKIALKPILGAWNESRGYNQNEPGGRFVVRKQLICNRKPLSRKRPKFNYRYDFKETVLTDSIVQNDQFCNQKVPRAELILQIFSPTV